VPDREAGSADATKRDAGPEPEAVYPLPGHLLFLVEFTVPLGFEGAAANSEFMRRVTDGARTRDLRSHYQSNAYSESGSTCLGWWPRTLAS
jgi:hypothetical protein